MLLCACVIGCQGNLNPILSLLFDRTFHLQQIKNEHSRRHLCQCDICNLNIAHISYGSVFYSRACNTLVILEYQYAVSRPGNDPVEELAASQETGPAAYDLTMTHLDFGVVLSTAS